MKTYRSQKCMAVLFSASCLIVGLLSSIPAFGDSTVTHTRTVTKLADGIYEIRHPDSPDTFPQGNTTVIIGERAVLVVDSCFLPSTARDDIAQIKQWTDKPVRYLVNTHWHTDHVRGNGEYAKAFPSIDIIAQVETKRQLEGYTPGLLARYPARVETFKRDLERGKNEDGRPLTEGEKKELTTAIAGTAAVVAEFQSTLIRLPNVGFERELNVDLGNREAQIKFLGKGNTAGDAVVYLPREKILVAGDLLDHPVPYLGGGYPFELVNTMKRMSEMDAETIVPGHGDVLHGKEYIGQVIKLVDTVTKEVRRQVYLIGNGPRHLEEVRAAVLKSVDLASFRQQFAGNDSTDRDFFDGFSIGGLVTAAYAEIWGQ